MFRKMKNIDTAFRHVRSFTMLVISGCVLISCFAVYKSFSLVSVMQDKIYILASGKVLQAYASNREENIPVEARDHIKAFHRLFFTLAPDEKAIAAGSTKALYLADASAKRIYDDLRETGYYAGIISGNVSQAITIDSIKVDVTDYPYLFLCYGTQRIVRPTTITTRSLVTGGALRSVMRSDNNPHGFLIERWRILENKDLHTENRRP